MVKKKESKIKIWVLVLTALLIITAVTITFLFVLNNENSGPGGLDKFLFVFSGTPKPPVTFKEIDGVDFSGSERIRFETYKGLLIAADKYKVEAYDRKGSKKWSLPVMLSNPLLKTGQNGILLADAGGRIIYFIDDGGILWYKETAGEIVNASINDNGFISVIHEKQGYKGAVTVYDPQGKEVYTRYIADTFVFSSHVFNDKSHSQQKVIISSIDITGIMPNTYLEFTDIRGNPFAGFIPEKGVLFPFTLTLDNGAFILHNESRIVLYDQNRDKKAEKNFGHISVVKSCVNGQIVIGARNNEADLHSKLIVLDNNFKDLFTLDIEDNIKTIDFAHGIIAVNTKREVYFYDTKGVLKFTYGSVSDIEEVLLLSSDHAVVVTSTRMIFTGE